MRGGWVLQCCILMGKTKASIWEVKSSGAKWERGVAKFLLCVASRPIYMIMTPTEHRDNNLTSLLFFSSSGQSAGICVCITMRWFVCVHVCVCVIYSVWHTHRHSLMYDSVCHTSVCQNAELCVEMFKNWIWMSCYSCVLNVSWWQSGDSRASLLTTRIKRALQSYSAHRWCAWPWLYLERESSTALILHWIWLCHGDFKRVLLTGIQSSSKPTNDDTRGSMKMYENNICLQHHKLQDYCMWLIKQIMTDHDRLENFAQSNAVVVVRS